MYNRERMELRHLGQAERHIVQAEIAMTRLVMAVERLRSRDCSTEREERSSAIMQETLDQFYEHRALILSEIYRPKRERLANAVKPAADYSTA
jgi:hypothetical protein